MFCNLYDRNCSFGLEVVHKVKVHWQAVINGSRFLWKNNVGSALLLLSSRSAEPEPVAERGEHARPHPLQVDCRTCSLPSSGNSQGYRTELLLRSEWCGLVGVFGRLACVFPMDNVRGAHGLSYDV